MPPPTSTSPLNPTYEFWLLTNCLLGALAPLADGDKVLTVVPVDVAPFADAVMYCGYNLPYTFTLGVSAYAEVAATALVTANTSSFLFIKFPPIEDTSSYKPCGPLVLVYNRLKTTTDEQHINPAYNTFTRLRGYARSCAIRTPSIIVRTASIVRHPNSISGACEANYQCHH